MMPVKRTTIMASDDLLNRLRLIARQEGVSLAEVIRQGLELRASQRRRPLFIGAVRTGQPTSIADEAEDLAPQARPWR